MSANSATWVDTYTDVSKTSASWVDTYTDVSQTSAKWDDVYSFVKGDSATNHTEYNQSTFVNASGDTITGDLKITGHLNGNTAYFTSVTALSTVVDVIDIKVRELSGYDVIEGDLTVQGDISASGDIYLDKHSLFFSNGEVFTSQDSIDSKNVYTDVSTTSGKWNDVYSSVFDTSATWVDVYTDVSETSATWVDVYTDVSETSANWNDSRATLQSTSGYWQEAYSNVQSSSGEWNRVYDDVYASVISNSATWVDVYTDVSETSANWNDSRATLQSTSATWVDVYTDVSETSANWNNVYSDVSANSATWVDVYTDVSETSATWVDVYSDVSETSATWNSVYTSVVDTSGEWDSVYTSVVDTSGEWDSVYSFVNTTSGDGDGYAVLGADGKILESQIPNLSISDVYTVSNPLVVEQLCSGDTAQGDVNIERGDVVVIASPPTTLIASVDNPTGLWTDNSLNPNIADTYDGFIRVSSPTDSVLSVNSKTGSVVLNPDDLDDSQTAHKFVSQQNIDQWNSTRNYVLDNQSDWNNVYSFVNADSATNNTTYNQSTFVNASGDTIDGDLHVTNQLTVDQHLAGNTAYFTSITALSTVVDVIDIKVRELSGYDIIEGDLTVQGDISASGDIYLNDRTLLFSSGETFTSQDSTNSKSVYTDVSNTSANWNTTYTSVTNTSATWDDAYSWVTAQSAENSITYNQTTFVNTSGDTIDGELIVTGDVEVQDNLTVSQSAKFSSDVQIDNNLTIKGDLRVDGNTFLRGDVNGVVNVGDTNTDSVVFHADIDSNILPDTTDTYQLGNSSQQWKDIHTTSINVSSNTSLSGDVAIKGQVTLDGHMDATTIHVASLTADNFETIQRQLHIDNGDLQVFNGNIVQRGGHVLVESDIAHVDDENTYIRFQPDSIQMVCHDLNMIQLNELPLQDDMIIIGDIGDTVDLRVQNPTDQNTLYIDGDTARVGIGTDNPQAKLHVAKGHVQLATGDQDGALMIPTGDDATRVNKPGSVRYNTELKRYEGYMDHLDSWIDFSGLSDADGDTYIDTDAESNRYSDSDRMAFFTAGCSAMSIMPDQTVAFAGDIRFDNITVYDKNVLAGAMIDSGEFLYLMINGKPRAIRLWDVDAQTIDRMQTVHGEIMGDIGDECARGEGGFNVISAGFDTLNNPPTEGLASDTDGDQIVDALETDDDDDGIPDYADVDHPDNVGEPDSDRDGIIDKFDPSDLLSDGQWELGGNNYWEDIDIVWEQLDGQHDISQFEYEGSLWNLGDDVNWHEIQTTWDDLGDPLILTDFDLTGEWQTGEDLLWSDLTTKWGNVSGIQ